MTRFEILCPPSLNVQKRWSIGQAKRFRDDLVLEMTQALNVAGGRPSTPQRLAMAKNPFKRVVKFLRFYGGNVKRLDSADNFRGACKPVLDELKLVTWRRRVYGQMVERNGFGFLFDDADEWCCAMYDQEKKVKKAGRLVVEIA